MDQPVVAQKAPYPIEVEEGKKYYVCTCGKSAKQPFCDGSHSDTAFKSMVYRAEATKTVYFCGCKHSNKLPLCDGTHKTLP